MTEHGLNPAKKVLVFGKSMKLLAVVRSMRTVSELMSEGSGNCATASISYAANGRQIRANGYYIRVEDPRVEIDIDDIGELDLKEYDQLCGVERIYSRTRYKKLKKQNADKNSKQVE